MPVKVEEILKKIDFVLKQHAKYDGCNPYGQLKRHTEMYTLLASTIASFAPKKSPVYYNFIYITKSIKNLRDGNELNTVNSSLAGILNALKLAYEHDLFVSVQEVIHADLFEDFLGMSEYLLSEGFKDASAVMVGGVLEEHLRKLCLKHGVEVEKSDGKPVKADKMNADLCNTAHVYNKGDNKSVTAWLDLRNNAAHAKYDQYSDSRVEVMLMGVRDFINRYPA